MKKPNERPAAGSAVYSTRYALTEGIRRMVVTDDKTNRGEMYGLYVMNKGVLNGKEWLRDGEWFTDAAEAERKFESDQKD